MHRWVDALGRGAQIKHGFDVVVHLLKKKWLTWIVMRPSHALMSASTTVALLPVGLVKLTSSATLTCGRGREGRCC
jgi:hypothetical protein